MQAPAIDATTVLFGLIGNPVAHSLSPVIHNRALTAVGYNGVYLAFSITDLEAALTGIRALNIKGVSVTIPYKTAVLPYLDAVDKTAAAIGAVNTIVNNHGTLTGHNTDCHGALEALKTKTGVEGKSVVIIGAGGGARAVGFGLASAGAHLTILNRSRTSGERLAAELGADFLPLDEWKPGSCDILINATPVGMFPQTGAVPIPESSLFPELLVMDIVYNPLQTRLLRAAAARNCTAINGVSMFVFQAALQFELWTGQKPPLDIMRRTALEALQTK